MSDIDELYGSMTESLQGNTSYETLLRAERGCEIAVEFLKRLKNLVLSHPFAKQEDEIHFFKEQKPLFLKEYLYYAELFRIESNRPIGSRRKEQEYLELNLCTILLFFDQNRFLYNYYRTGKTTWDHQLFVKEANPSPVQPDYGIDLAPDFSNVFSYNIGKILAYESIKRYLEHAQLKLSRVVPSPSDRARRQKWLGSKTEFIELCYALQSRGIFGNANVNEVIHYMEECFEVEAGNFYRVFQEQRIRKKSRTLFLDALKESLIRRMDDSDLNPRF